jgi:hypothetical protein
MARTVPEWVGKTDDSKAPPRVRLRIYEAHKGICFLSHRPIQAGEKWELHHVIGLEAGGENREDNLAPVLVEPHKKESKRQQAVKKKVNRTRKKHLGITAPKKQIQSPGFPKAGKKPRIQKQEVKRQRPLYRSVS